MTETTELTYDDLARELDDATILSDAYAVADRLSLGLTVGLVYQPGNGTRYDLLFVPAQGISQASTSPVPSGCDGEDGRSRDGWTVVSKLNGTTFSYPFDLSPENRAHVSYVREHSGLGFADAAALTALFRSIAGVPILDVETA
jgi:hypothetical protein